MDSKASARLCFHLHRTGPLCGECEDNYTLPAYSYYLGCVRCESYKNGWIKFIAAAFLPLTLFYMVAIAFRISATSPTLNAFVMANQVLAIPRVVHRLYSNNLMIDRSLSCQLSWSDLSWFYYSSCCHLESWLLSKLLFTYLPSSILEVSACPFARVHHWYLPNVPYISYLATSWSNFMIIFL